MKVKTPEMLEKMRARMKHARETRLAQKQGSLKDDKPISKLCPDGHYYGIFRVSESGGLFQLVNLHVVDDRVVGGMVSNTDIFGVQMGKIMTLLEENH